MSKLKHLDLCSGIGGFALGFQRTGGIETDAFCEIDPFCRAVLEKNFPGKRIYHDVRSTRHDEPVDIISAGYPCQPFSTAGRRLGDEDDRHLWPDIIKIIEEKRPAWVVCENVVGHVSMGFDRVLSDLEGAGYASQGFIIPACAVFAPHRRDRLWIVAHSQRKRQPRQGGHYNAVRTTPHDYREASRFVDAFQGGALPFVCGGHDGVPARLAECQLHALGNAVDPKIPEIIGHAILEAGI